MSQVVEVAGKIEVQTSRRSSRVQKPQNKKSKDKMISVNCLKRNVKKEKVSVLSTLANEELFDNKVDSLVKSAEKLEENHCWKTTTKNNEDKHLKWQWNLGQYQQENFHKLNDECSGKLPVEVFDMIFNSSMRDLITKESTNYAKTTHNDANFAMTENELKQYLAVLFLAGHHSLPQQRLYWERCIDVDITIVYKSISKNKFPMIKKYAHLSDDTTSDKADKYAKVRPLHNLTNSWQVRMDTRII